jgi:hypothetical protein
MLMMDKLKEKFYKLFRCLINVGRPKKKDDNRCTLERVELFWKEKTYHNSANLNEVLGLSDILGIDMITEVTIDGIADASDDII